MNQFNYPPYGESYLNYVKSNKSDHDDHHALLSLVHKKSGHR